MKKKLIAIILCICLISCTCIQPAYAMGAEGAIIGGAAGAAGITLSMPQVAILVAAGFGLVYAVNHADDIANGLNNALNNAATNISNGIEELNYWKEQATKGAIALSSAPAWIKAAVKSWINGLYEAQDTSFAFPTEYKAGEQIVGADFWNSNPTTYTFNKDVTVVRAGKIETINSNGSKYYQVTSYLTAFSLENFTGSSAYYMNIGGTSKTYHTKFVSSSSAFEVDKLAGANKVMYDAVSTLPDYKEISKAFPNYGYIAQQMMAACLTDYFGVPENSICPDVTIGGISNALGEHSIDNIKVPDLDIGGSKLLTPENVADGSIDDVLNDVLTRLKQQEITWEQYMTDVAVGTPSVAIPQADGTTLEFPITDTGVSDIPIDTPIDTPVNPPAGDIVVPEGLEPFTISLKDFFPFCIPFDIADFINVLCAEPEAPSFEWEFPSVDGTTEKLTIDLTPFDSAAQLLRNMELLLFCIGLALMTRNLIRG